MINHSNVQRPKGEIMNPIVYMQDIYIHMNTGFATIFASTFKYKS